MHSLLLHPLTAATAAVAIAAAAGCGGSHHASPTNRAASASSAARLVVVPDLIGRHQADAHRIAARAGLGIRWTGFAGKLGNGRYNISCVKVLRQAPVAGEHRPAGSLIAIIETACHVPKEAPHGVST